MSFSDLDTSDTSQSNNNQLISVLYVDDEEVLLKLTKILMERSGEFRVDTAISAKEALNSPLIQSYDAIVSDYQMPVMDGIAFLKVVREQFGDIPFILFTGRGREEIVIEAINNGADFYLQKGGKPEAQFAELQHKIRQAVRRKKAEQELRRSEERYRTVINDQTEMIARFTPDGTVTFTNDAYHLYFSPLLGLDKIIGKNIREIMQIPNYDFIEQFLHSLTVESPVDEMEREVIDRDNKKLWQIWTVRALYDRENTLYEYQVVGRDITEKKLAQAAVAESESRLRSFIETSSEAVSICDEEGKVIEWNASSEQVTGIPKKEALGMYIWDLTYRLTPREKQTEEKRKTIEQAFRTSLATGVPVFTEPHIVEAQRPDGTRIFSRQIIFPIKSEKGFRFGSISQDITEEKHIEDKLRESEERFRGMAERSNNLIITLDNSLSTTYVSSSAKSILGYDPEELIGKTSEFAIAAIFSQSAPEFMNALQKTMGGESINDNEFLVSKKDGTPVYVKMYTVPTVQDGVLTGVQVSIRDITVTKKADNALRESEERFRGMAERSSDLVFVLGADMSPTYVSPSARQIILYDPEELVGKPPEFAQATIFSQSGPDLMNAVQATMRGDIVENVEIQISKKDNTPVFINLYAVPVIQNGIVTGAQVSMRDITAVKKAEFALRDSEERFRGMAERSSDLVFIVDDKMGCTYVSPSARSIIGYEPEELMDKPLEFAATTIFSQSGPEIMNAIQTTWQGESVKNVEFQISKKDGTTVFVNVYAVPMIRDGMVTGVQVSMRDITAAKKAENALRKSEQRFLAVTNNAGSWIWEIDPEGIYTYSSPIVEEILGYRPEELVGKVHFLDLVDPSGKEELKKIAREVFDSHESFRDYVYISRHKNGSRVILKTSGTPIFDEEGTFSGYYGGDQDITEHKRFEEALRQANRQLNLLSGITRHDILNEISVMYGYLGIMETECTDPRLSGYLQIMKSSITKIQSQIEFTGVYHNIGSHEPQWIELDTVMPRSSLPSSITLIADVQNVRIFSDPMLEKVFFNLLDNSVRHGQRVTEIRVSAHTSDNGLTVLWEDNGIGIAEKEKEKIFERGFGKNTGLGMFLVRDILSLTGISIRETGVPGKGVRFEISVPEGGWWFNKNGNA